MFQQQFDHLPVATGSAEENRLQAFESVGQVDKRRAVAQRNFAERGQTVAIRREQLLFDGGGQGVAHRGADADSGQVEHRQPHTLAIAVRRASARRARSRISSRSPRISS